MGRFLTETSIPNYAKTSRIIYDAEGEAQGIELSASSDTECNSSGILLYRKNLQGDITGLINTDGKLLCEFTYDAYGNIGLHTESNLGAVLSGIVLTLFIPQLYRGYVYTFVGDEVCYYLGSRFYSPKLGRFLNADKHTDTGTGVNGTNMFAYCNNNPVMFVDPTGESIAIPVAAKFIITFFVLLCTSIALYFIAVEILRLLPMLDLYDIVDSLEQLNKKMQIDIVAFREFVKAVSLAVSQYVEKVITEILQKAKESKLSNKRYDLHHIVAKKAPSAFIGIMVLDEVGIDVEDSRNKVKIVYRLHAYLNTNSYNAGVGLFLADVYFRADKNNKNAQKKNVINGLLLLKVALQTASAMVS